MKLQKLACLEFTGGEFEENFWQEIDDLAENRVLLASETKLDKDTDGLFVKLGAKVSKDLIDTLPNLKYIGMLGNYLLSSSHGF